MLLFCLQKKIYSFYRYSFRPLSLLLSLALIMGLIFTWPLATFFFNSIPYSLFPAIGFERVQLMPGDHLQTYFWFWLFIDNLFGSSPLFTNPYEFNTESGPIVGGYANFPWSLIYLLFLPLGPIGAYNTLILLSFILCALAGFLLARIHTGNPWTSLLAGLALAVAPLRVSQVVGGQLFGLIAFLLPLTLYFVEKAMCSKQAIFGWLAGLCLIAMAPMEPHLTYLTVLTLVIYIPGRLITSDQIKNNNQTSVIKKWPWIELISIAISGLSITSAFIVAIICYKPDVNPWSIHLFFWFLAIGITWLLLTTIIARLTTLSFLKTRRSVAFCFLAWVPLSLYIFQLKINLPYLGLILISVSIFLFFYFLIRLCWLQRCAYHAPLNWFGLQAAGIGVGVGIILAATYLLKIRSNILLNSLAGKGRELYEVMLYSPCLENLFTFIGGNNERFIFLGLSFIGLALLGIVPLLINRDPINPGHRILAAFLSLLSGILCLGPKVFSFPLYHLLYKYLPFFNYPRVPARYLLIAFVFMGVLSAYALTDLYHWLIARINIKLTKVIIVILSLLPLAEYHTLHPVGICQISLSNQLYQTIASSLTSTGLVLELPLWPGDSHQSSTYEYTVTHTKKPMINGYSPVVSRRYINEIFWPLNSLNLGQLEQSQAELLHRLNVAFIIFHDEFLLYNTKINPFPPSLTIKRLESSGWLTLLSQDSNIRLYSLRKKPNFPYSSRLDKITSPITVVRYAHNFTQETGRKLFSKQTSGYNLQLIKKSNNDSLKKRSLYQITQGNLLEARPTRDQPGYLALGAGSILPPGQYIARFRLQIGPTIENGSLGAIEIILNNQSKILAKRPLLASAFTKPWEWVDIPLYFVINESSLVETRVKFAGRSPLLFNLVLINFADQILKPIVFEAEDLFRQGGIIIEDPLASGGKAILAEDLSPLIWIMHGPYCTLESGYYQARFFIRELMPIIKDNFPLAYLEIATDMGQLVFAKRKVTPQDLKNSNYQIVEVKFFVPFRSEVDLRICYLGQGKLLIDRVELEKLS